MAPGTDLAAQSPPARIPKLRYRNPLPAGETTPSLGTRRDSAHQPRDADDPPATPDSKGPSEYMPSFDTASLTPPRLTSTSSVSSSDDSRSSKEKKRNAGLFGFLFLREPSQDALKQYADAQRKQAAEKGAPSSSSSHQLSSSYSGKKLPHGVPKVNSRWDGVPESAKPKSLRSSAASKKN